jgi:hypothetical protein
LFPFNESVADLFLCCQRGVSAIFKSFIALTLQLYNHGNVLKNYFLDSYTYCLMISQGSKRDRYMTKSELLPANTNRLLTDFCIIRM